MASVNNPNNLDAYTKVSRIAAESAGVLKVSELRQNWLSTVKGLGSKLKGKMGDVCRTQISINCISRMVKPIAATAIKAVAIATGNDIDEATIDKTIDVIENGVRWVSTLSSTLLSKEIRSKEIRDGVKQFCDDTVKLAKGVGNKVVEKVKTGGLLSEVTNRIKSVCTATVEKATVVIGGIFSRFRRVGEMVH